MATSTYSTPISSPVKPPSKLPRPTQLYSEGSQGSGTLSRASASRRYSSDAACASPLSPWEAGQPAELSPPARGPREAPFTDCNSGATDSNVRVVVRVRPHNGREARTPGARAGGCLSISDERTVALAEPGRVDPYVASFDQVLGESSSQEDMYRAVGQSMVDHCMAGFNSSIFAYGQTGSGKTFTMLGDPERDASGRLAPGCGLVPRVFEALFAAVGHAEQALGHDTLRYSVKCSFLEIYNEEVTDLLAPGASGLQIRDGDMKRGVYVQGLSETEVLNADDVLALITHGSANRHMAATHMNERSSRSHSVFTATIQAHECGATGLTTIRYAKLNLIDLAGSERVGRSGATGEQLTEAKSINRSLAVLGRVIAALVERQKRGGGAAHVPYRDSRLTFLLQESLGGNSRTCIVANVTPAVDSAAETFSTLAFAAGAKKITCHAVVNEDTLGDVKALQAENARLQRALADLREGRAAAGASEVAALRRQLDQLQELFDQNNAAITGMRAEQGVLRRERDEARALAARSADEAVQLRALNAAVGHDVERLREEKEDVEAALLEEREKLATQREKLAAEVESLRGDRDVVLSCARAERERLVEDRDRLVEERERMAAEGCKVAAERDRLAERMVQLREEAAAVRAEAAVEVARVGQELSDAKGAFAAAAAALEEARNEAARVQAEARSEAAAAAAREADVRREADAWRDKVAELEGEADALRRRVAGESTNVAKYRRMVGEIGRLVDWAQTSSSQGAAAAAAAAMAGARRSPAAAAALHAARLSLGVSSPPALHSGNGGPRKGAMATVSAGGPDGARGG